MDNDAAAAWKLACELAGDETPGASVIKHTNPCGAAHASNATDAVRLAIAGDPLAAYGGILAVSGVVNDATAQHICAEGRFFEVVLAHAFEPDALERIKDRWKNVRIMTPPDTAYSLSWRTLDDNTLLVQQSDDPRLDDGETIPGPETWTHAAGPAPDATRLAHAAAVWTTVRHLTSNAIAIGGAAPESPGDVRLFGAGAGQMDRVASCEIAITKAGALATGAIAASDAFFPFPDGPQRLVDAGVTMIVHPGGSKRDGETFALCDERGVTCMTTGWRHFRH